MTAAVKFTRKTLPQKEGLGEKLAKKRISLGLDIKDIEKAIRIRAKYIEAIENGRYDNLPPDVYVRGFITNYASYLKLDPNKVLKLFERERGLVESVKRAKSAPIVKPIDTPKLIITPKTITIFTIVAIFTLILGYIGWQVSILTAPPKLVLSSPSDNSTTSSNSTIVSGQTDQGAALQINGVSVGIDQDGSFKEKINLQSGVNIIKIVAKNKLGRSTESNRTIVSQYSQGSGTNTAGTFELKITVGPRSSSILVTIDGKNATDKPIVMLAGVSQTYRAASNIKIVASDGGSVQAVYDGKNIGALGKNNEQTTREFVKGMTIK